MTIAKWMVITGITVIVLLMAGVGVLGAMVSRDDVGVSSPSRMMRMEQSGQVHEMMQQHQNMLDRMRSDASPQTLRQMENDPMTKMMRSGGWMRMQEQHQAEINRMLGRG